MLLSDLFDIGDLVLRQFHDRHHAEVRIFAVKRD